MTKTITVDRGHDGFGSQFYARISGISYARYHKLNYIHTPITGIRLDDKPYFRNDEIEDANKMLTNIMNNLQIKSINQVDDNIQIDTHQFFYDEVVKDEDIYFNQKLLEDFYNSYSEKKPEYYPSDRLNIAIHIRRGEDITSEHTHRYVESDVYDSLIQILLSNHKEALIHIFSWGDPKINIKSERLIYHIDDGGGKFLSDFNGLVHADILVVGSSTFSISAGMFNKNIVVCDKKICRLDHVYPTPFPSKWQSQFRNIIGII